jgi:diguanylate cyclase (GGDEF)-like protein
VEDDTSRGIVPTLAAGALEAMPVGVAVVDAAGIVVAANHAWRTSAGAAVGQPLVPPPPAERSDLSDLVDAGLERVLASNHGSVELEVPEEGPAGTSWSLLYLVSLPEGGAVVTRVDVTRTHEVIDLVSAAAIRDPLTGLPQRALVEESLATAVARSERGEAVPAVLFLDLDGFKAVNDDLGHEAGDRVLARVGQRLSDALRASDTCGRWGGDEFVVVVELDANRVDAALEQVVERIAETVRRPVELDDAVVRVGVSIGAAVVRAGDSPRDVVRMADGAMYEAKRTGRSVVVARRAEVDLGERRRS